MEYYSILKRDELSCSEKTWKKQMHITNERSQSEKVIYHVILIMPHIGKAKSMEIQERSVVARKQTGVGMEDR